MLLAVIRHTVRVALDFNEHFVRDRRDRQLAFGLGDIVVAFFEVRAFRVGDRVRHFTFGNVRYAARRLDFRHFAFNKAVAANRHVRLRQRGAVVSLAGRFGGQRHIALVDRQRTRIRRRNDIFLRRVNLVQRITRFSFILFKFDRISSSIRSRRARCGKSFKGNAFRRTGKAGNALLRSIISLRLAVRRQLDVLMIVEIDLVRSRPNRNRLRSSRYRRVAIGPDGGFRHRTIERLFVNGLGIRNLSGRPVPVVVHRVAQVGSRPEYRFEHRLLIQTILLIQKRSGLCIRQIRTRVDALEVIFVDDLNPVVKFISGARGVSPYGRQIIADDRTVCFHNLARHDLHMLRNRIERLVELSVSVRRVNNFDVLFRVRHPLRGIRRGSLHRLRNLRSPAIKLPAGLAVLISRKSGSRIVIFCGVFLFRKGIGSMVALPILDRKGVLFVVENDLVRSLDDRDRLRGFRYQFIAFNIRCFLCHQFVKRLILHSLCIAKLLVRARLKVFHRVSQIVFSGVYNINRHVVAGHPAINNQFIRLIADDRRRSYAVESSILYIILRIRIL